MDRLASHNITHSALRRISRIWLWRLIGRIAFNRIGIIGKDRLPSTGPVLFVATHRNGALDAAPYVAAIPEAVPMVSAQLHRLPLGRLLFHGIAVARAKDRERGIEADTGAAMRECLTLLKMGGQLLVMPEGTSALGPKHLPFHRGAARIIKAALDAGIVPTIVPLGVHYEDPTVWQSRVEVLVGEPVRPHPEDSVMTIHRQITQGLESVGANFENEAAQRTAEAVAYARTLGTAASYACSLKYFEQNMPEAVTDSVRTLNQLAQQERLCLHQGVPLIPVGPRLLYAAYWLVLAPLVAGFCILNAPVLCAGFVASRKLPDDRNVIAFWRMVIGVPSALLWAVLATIVFWVLSGFTGVGVYWFFSVSGIFFWYRFRKLSVSLCNVLFHGNVRSALLDAYEKLLELMPDEKTA